MRNHHQHAFLKLQPMEEERRLTWPDYLLYAWGIGIALVVSAYAWGIFG